MYGVRNLRVCFLATSSSISLIATSMIFSLTLFFHGNLGGGSLARSAIDGNSYFERSSCAIITHDEDFLSFMMNCLVTTLFVSSFLRRDSRKVRIFMWMVRSIGILPLMTFTAEVAVLSGRPSMHLSVFR